MNMTLKTWLTRYDYNVENIQHTIVPLLLLFCRLWVAWAFFNSGLVKIASWDSTLYLFELEYQVPILPWELAAYLGTTAELTLPIFVALGLLSRPMALTLFIFNIVAVISSPVLWEQGFYDHQLWGVMLLLVVVWGAGPISVDRVLRQRISK
ncbi:DoxX family protein [Vibrio aestuarianus]|uniref:DoxX family protein n=1 Tax=Vibrio aestuarianus TaxID=28171 RepID=UPI00237CEDBD|nr:DoxX family protein [Vibrio aestuarianus]MDE1315287.1 DoxX family protein [Vibrio aestuarianus]